MPPPAFVDCHSHVVPSGDDGARSVEEGIELCRAAADHGTGILFATPHVWPHLPLTEERERALGAAYADVRAAAPLELRLGFELTPSEALLEEDVRRYALEGTDRVLLDTPFVGPLELLLELAGRVREQGLWPIAAHPERAEAVQLRPGLAAELARAGLLLQVNATSLIGYHGPAAESLGWRLVEEELATIVGSDGHRPARPPQLDAAYAAVRRRVGEGADAFFDGSALGLRRRHHPLRRKHGAGRLRR